MSEKRTLVCDYCGKEESLPLKVALNWRVLYTDEDVPKNCYRPPHEDICDDCLKWLREFRKSFDKG